MDTELEEFLAQVEARALGMAQYGTGNLQDALDVVQDAMYAFVRSYGHKPADEWRPLFYKVLRSRIADHHRKRSVRQRVMGFFRVSGGSGPEDGQDGADAIQYAPDGDHTDPSRIVAAKQGLQALEAGLAELSDRQREVFLLRAWEGLSVQETAQAMGCSQGAVKTHYHRAVEALRTRLGDHIDEVWT